MQSNNTNNNNNNQQQQQEDKKIHHLKFENPKNEINIKAKNIGYEEEKQGVQIKHGQDIINQASKDPLIEQNEEDEKEANIPHLQFQQNQQNPTNINFVVQKNNNSPKHEHIQQKSSVPQLQQINESNTEGNFQNKGHRHQNSRSTSRSRSRFSQSPRNKSNSEQQLEHKLNQIEEEITNLKKDSPKSFKKDIQNFEQGISEYDNEEEEEGAEPILEKEEENLADTFQMGQHKNTHLGNNLKKLEDITQNIEADELDNNRKRNNSMNVSNKLQYNSIPEEDEKNQ